MLEDEKRGTGASRSGRATGAPGTGRRVWLRTTEGLGGRCEGIGSALRVTRGPFTSRLVSVRCKKDAEVKMVWRMMPRRAPGLGHSLRRTLFSPPRSLS